MIKDIQPKFSPWRRLAEADVEECGGVYLLAHFESAPPTEVDPIAKEIVYVGETCGQGLRKRLKQFAKSARDGRFAHAGGRNYFAIFKGIRKDLFVATFSPPDLPSKVEPAFIRYVERKLIWEYARKWEAMPLCNRK